jgi:hypothetical protein
MKKKREQILVGAGNLGQRRQIWWMTYYDAAGVRIQKSTGTRDRAEAEQMLARTTLPIIEAKVERLRAIAYGREAAGRRRGADSNPAHAPAAARGGRRRSGGVPAKGRKKAEGRA